MARGRGGRGRGGQGNKGRGKRNRGPGKNRRNRVSRTNKRNKISRKPRGISGSTRKKMAGDRRKKRLSKVTNKSLKSRIKSLGLNKTETKKKTISASQSRKQVRQNTKDKIATRKKLTFRNVLGRLTRPAGAYASSAQGTQQSKLRRQLSNLRSDIAQKSTKEARYNRRADRLKKQFGLDTRDMRNLKLNLNLDTVLRQKFKIPGTNIKIGVNDRIRKSLPKSIRNFRRNYDLGGKFRSPHKLGVREGYRRPNRGQGIRRPIQRPMPIDTRLLPPEFGRPVRGVPGGMVNDMQYIPDRYKPPIHGDPGPRRLPRMGPEPERDWLGDFYKRYNISGGKVDQEARDYWTNEAKTKGRTATLDIIRGTARNQGTWGGMSEEDEARIARIPKGSRTNWKGRIIDRRSAGKPGRRKKRRANKQNRAVQRSYDLQVKGHKRRQGMIANTIAATMAARGI